MTVKELIEALQKAPPDSPVFFWAHASRREVSEVSQDEDGEVWLAEK